MFDLFEFADRTAWARRERDAGMAQATDHADDVVPEWQDMAFDFLVAFAKRHPFFISEDVSYASKGAGFPQPPTDRAWGSVYRRAAKAGLIVQHGIGRSNRRHRSICPQWRSLCMEA